VIFRRGGGQCQEKRGFYIEGEEEPESFTGWGRGKERGSVAWREEGSREANFCLGLALEGRKGEGTRVPRGVRARRT